MSALDDLGLNPVEATTAAIQGLPKPKESGLGQIPQAAPAKLDPLPASSLQLPGGTKYTYDEYLEAIQTIQNTKS